MQVLKEWNNVIRALLKVEKAWQRYQVVAPDDKTIVNVPEEFQSMLLRWRNVKLQNFTSEIFMYSREAGGLENYIIPITAKDLEGEK